MSRPRTGIGPQLAPTVSPSPLYLHEAGVTASANASDAGAGVASQSCGAINTSTAGDHTVTCTATDNAGNTSTATVHYVVEYRVLGFVSPTARSKWRVGSSVPVKVALGDVNGVRIGDGEAAALASAARVTFSATGAQSLAAQPMKYDATKDQFAFIWKLTKTGTGSATITVTVSYPGTMTKTSLSEPITITS